MNFNLTEQQQQIVDQVREFTAQRLAPGVLERDEQQVFPVEAFKEFGAMGMFGLCYPKEFGGTDVGYLPYILAVEEVSKVDSSFGIGFSVNTSLYGGSVMYSSATDEQKKRFLSPIASGKAIGSFGLTEASAGSDAAGQKTIATKDGDYYILTGTKIFTTNGPLADYTVIYALTDPSVGTKSMCAFVVEKGMEGFHVGKVENKMGIRSAQVSEMVLSNVRVSADRMIAKPGEGYKLAMKTLETGTVRQAPVQAAVPGIQNGRALCRHRKGQARPLQGCLPERRRQALHDGRSRSEAHLHRRSHEGHDGMRTDARRQRLHARISCRTHDARRKNHPNLRRHKRNPETGHFRRLVPS